MAAQRLSTADLRGICTGMGIPFGKEIVYDDIDDDYEYDDYGMRVGTPKAVWANSANNKPATVQNLLEEIASRMKFYAREDPVFFLRKMVPFGQNHYAQAVRQYVPRSKQAKLLQTMEQAIRAAQKQAAE